MNRPARDMHSGIDGQTNAAQGRNGAHDIHEVFNGTERMSSPAAGCFDFGSRGLNLADGAGVSTSVRPGRVRNRTKTEGDEKVKKPADEIRKKSPPARKAPARGRYVDEYARPAP